MAKSKQDVELNSFPAAADMTYGFPRDPIPPRYAPAPTPFPEPASSHPGSSIPPYARGVPVLTGDTQHANDGIPLSFYRPRQRRLLLKTCLCIVLAMLIGFGIAIGAGLAIAKHYANKGAAAVPIHSITTTAFLNGSPVATHTASPRLDQGVRTTVRTHTIFQPTTLIDLSTVTQVSTVLQTQTETSTETQMQTQTHTVTKCAALGQAGN